MTNVGFEPHDHSVCIADCIAMAEAICAEKGLQFTPTRRRVLEILLEEHRAMGAYDILDVLRSEGAGSQPPVAYRALDFLTSNGFAHKIERLNAFIACSHPHQDHAPAFLICTDCDAVAEAPSHPAQNAMNDSIRDTGFQVNNISIEAEGVCPKCQDAQSKASA